MPALLMVVGSLNREVPFAEGARGVGLSLFRFDPATGRATLLCEDGSIDNPTYLSADAGTGCLYATSEVSGWHEGTVSAYRYDGETRRLAYINKQPSLGRSPAHNTLDIETGTVLVVNYGDGPEGEGPDRALVAYRLRPDGGLEPPSSSVAHRGRGPDVARQERAHPHCVQVAPRCPIAVVADLGLDALLAYRLASDGTLSAQPLAVSPLPPGCGPRHLVFHPDVPLALVICELDRSILSLRFDPETGRFAPLSAISTLPEGWQGRSFCSDVRIAPGGRFVYGANRGHDSIAVVALDPATGGLSARGHVPSGGRTPRHLALDPSGRHLVVANQDSDEVVVFAIDAVDGGLSEVARIAVGSPMCVAFMGPA